MAKLRISPFVSLIEVDSRIFVRTDLKTFTLTGGDVQDFLRRALPLLDGNRDAKAILEAFPDYSDESVRAFLTNLKTLGLVVEAGEDTNSPDILRQEKLSAFVTSWEPSVQDIKARLSREHVAIVGEFEWLAGVCQELEQSGVERLTKLSFPNGAKSFEPPDDITLLLAIAHPDELGLFDMVARLGEQRKLRYLIAQIDGLSAILGPVVIPGQTACWECLRSRRLANQPSFSENALLQSQLLSKNSTQRRRLSPPGAVAILTGLILGETIKLLTNYTPSHLVGRQLEFNLITHATEIHDLIRLPWCSVCGGAASSENRGSSSCDPMLSQDVAELRTNLAGWVDQRLGIVQQLALNYPSPNEPQCLSTATAIVSGSAVLGSHHYDPLIGAGKGTTKIAAMLGAVGEAIERYSASVYREQDLLRATWKDLSDQAFDPASLCLYLPTQYAQPGFPYRAFDSSQELSWTPALWLDSGDTVLVPALATFFNYRARPGELLCQVTSNGLAAGVTFEDAALRATLELIERDTFMMTWLRRKPPQLLEMSEELGSDVMEIRLELRELGMDTELYLLEGDIRIPTVMCVAWGDGKTRPAASVALAAHFDPIEAARKALLELAHVGPYITRLMADKTQRIPRAATDVKTLNDHALFYVPKNRLSAFDFIRSGRRRAVRLSRLTRPSKKGTDVCISALAQAGLRVAVADVTSPDIRLGPFRVARALGTFVQPIDFGHHQRRLANPRLRGVTINPYPHPLA